MLSSTRVSRARLREASKREPVELRLIQINDWPPSVNGLYRAINGLYILTKKARAWYKNNKLMLHPMEGRLGVTIKLYPPDRRRRDIDNYSNAVIDLLTKSEAWLDDEQVDLLTVSRETVVPKPGKVTIEIWPLQEKT